MAVAFSVGDTLDARHSGQMDVHQDNVWRQRRQAFQRFLGARAGGYALIARGPQFNRETLRSTLKDAGIAYVFLGKELGARSDDVSCYLNGKVQYDCLARSALFRGGLDRVEQGLSKHRIALMCAEKDPLTCHRSILVCRHLVEREIGVAHILADAQLESHDEAMSRLLRELRIDTADLFRDKGALFAEAYTLRGDEIAYIDKSAMVPSRASR